MTSTWGYFGGQVGEWGGTVPVARPRDGTSVAAVAIALRRLLDALAAIHRPTRLSISWGEFDQDGRELHFHEGEEGAVDSWEGILEIVQGLGVRGDARVAVSSLAVDLETRIASADGERWVERSASLHASVDDELEPTALGFLYATYIDVWLTTTYGEGFAPVSNRDLSLRNRPRLIDTLRKLTEIGGALELGKSELYPFAMTERGFEAIETLPPRR